MDIGTWFWYLCPHFRGRGIEWWHLDKCPVTRIARSILQGCQISFFKLIIWTKIFEYPCFRDEKSIGSILETIRWTGLPDLPQQGCQISDFYHLCYNGRVRRWFPTYHRDRLLFSNLATQYLFTKNFWT